MKKNILNLIKGLLAAFIIIIALDVILRFYLYAKTGRSEYIRHFTVSFNAPSQLRMKSELIQYNNYYKFTPGNYQFLSGGNFDYRINKYGLRGKDFPLQKPAGVVRVCALGGSTTFGNNVKDGETYPACLQEILSRKYEVINCGLPSFKMLNIYYFFKDDVIRCQPDFIIICEAYNDAFNIPLVISRRNLAFRLHKFFYYRWMLYTVLLEKYSAVINKCPNPFSAEKNGIDQDFTKYLIKIIELARSHNITVVLVKQWLNDKTGILAGDHTQSELEKMYSSAQDANTRRVIRFCYYTQEMEKIAREYNLLFVDPTKDIQRDKTLFIDPVHLYPKGNRILAEQIAEAFK